MTSRKLTIKERHSIQITKLERNLEKRNHDNRGLRKHNGELEDLMGELVKEKQKERENHAISIKKLKTEREYYQEKWSKSVGAHANHAEHEKNQQETIKFAEDSMARNHKIIDVLLKRIEE